MKHLPCTEQDVDGSNFVQEITDACEFMSTKAISCPEDIIS